MLADDVTEMIQQITHSDRTDSARHALPAWREIHAGISAAERYLLDDSVAAAAQNVAFMKPSSILEAIGFARLPHGRVWVEWLEKARKEIVRAHGIPIVEDSETRPQPRRVGFLL